MTFCFPIENINLTKNRINLLSSTIKRCGGIVIDFSSPENEETFVDYVIIDDLIPRQKVIDLIGDSFDYYQILNRTFIEECVRESKKLNIENYFISDE